MDKKIRNWLSGSLGLDPLQGISLLVGFSLIAAGTHQIVHEVKNRYQNDLSNSLQTVLHSSNEALTVWSRDHRLVAENIAKSEVIIKATQQLLKVPPVKTQLLAYEGQNTLRNWFSPYIKSGQYRGFFIISPKNVSLASSRDANTGTTNLLVQQPDVLNRLWNGQSTISQIMVSDVPLSHVHQNNPENIDPTLFVGAPIKNDKDEIIALLTLRLDPKMNFFSLLSQSRLGKTGETYVINRQGVMLTTSRFEEQLHQSGLLKPGASSALNMKVTDPGPNPGSLLTTDRYGVLQQPLTFMAQNLSQELTGHNLEGYRDYRGIPVAGAWTWNSELGVGLATEQDIDEAYGTFYIIRALIYVAATVTAVILLALALIFNISRRKIKETETQLTAIINTAIDSIIVINQKGIILNINPSFEKLTGYSRNELVGHNISNVMPEPHKSGHDKYLENYLKTGRAKIIGIGREVEIRHANKTLIPVDLSVSRLDIGSEIHFAGIIHDLSERKEAEQKLLKNKDLLLRSQQIAHVGSWEWDIASGQLIWTDETFRIFGLHKETDNPDYDMFINCIHTNDRKRVTQAIELAKKNGHTYEVEHRLIRPDGEIRHVQEVGRVYRNNEGQATRMIGVVQDITERVKAEESLRQEKEATEALNQILQLTQKALGKTGISEFWVSAVDGRVLYVSDHACNHLGYSREEMLKMNVEDFDPAFNRKQFSKMTAPIREHGAGRLETTHKTKFGETIPVEVTAAYRPAEHGREAMFITFVTNISKRKEIEQELVESREKAEYAVKAQSAFLATMSHEIRTPMNGVVGIIELLLNTPLNSEQEHMAHVINDSAFSLLRIIDDILDFSKIEAGKLRLENAPLNLVEICESTIDTLRPIASGKGVRLYLDEGDDLDTPLLGDATRVRQILYNLCGNAIKFTDQNNGHVILKVRFDQNKETNDVKAKVRFEVRDNGIGMSQEVIDMLFTPFYQAEASTTRRFGGTGLGLSICKNLVHMMGGDIYAESIPNKGSAFTVELPFDIDPVEKLTPQFRTHDLRIICYIVDEFEREIVGRYLKDYHPESKIVDSLDFFEDLARNKAPYDVLFYSTPYTNPQEIEATKAMLDKIRTFSKGEARMVLASYNPKVYASYSPGDTVLLENLPLKRYALRTAVAAAAGRTSPPVKIRDTAKIEFYSPATREEAVKNHQLVLIVEDNPTNQEVISNQLELLGYVSDIADDGAQAFEMWRKEPYALVLTDCHMPVMDGYQLTKKIRHEEAHRNRPHTPIVAITANAIQGEGEKCLHAGMDGYLSKPVQLKVMKKELIKWVAPIGTKIISSPSSTLLPAPEKGGEKLIQLDVLSEYVGDDPSVQKDLIEKFIKNAQSTIKEIEIAIEDKDMECVAEIAHRIKSSSSAIGAEQLTNTFLELERCGKEQRVDEVIQEYGKLNHLLDRITQEFQTLTFTQ